MGNKKMKRRRVERLRVDVNLLCSIDRGGRDQEISKQQEVK
jgi:hypothetical protein